MKRTEVASQLKTVVAEVLGVKVNQEQAEKILSGYGEIVLSSLEKREDVKTDHGVYKLVERSARKGRNPQTGEEIDIPVSYGYKLQATKAVKERLNTDAE